MNPKSDYSHELAASEEVYLSIPWLHGCLLFRILFSWFFSFTFGAPMGTLKGHGNIIDLIGPSVEPKIAENRHGSTGS